MAAETVKTHLKKIFWRLQVENRATTFLDGFRSFSSALRRGLLFWLPASCKREWLR
jgi:hypothetical protein